MTAVLVPPGEQASRDRMWAAVDQLTQPTRRKVERDDGTVTWADVPSLLDQAADLVGIGEGGGSRVGSAAERNIVDHDLIAVLGIIASYTTRTLVGWGETDAARLPMPARLRRLASASLVKDSANLWWWEYRMSAWAALLATVLDAGDRRQPAAIRLRNAACPVCRVRQVTIETEDGPVVAPPILVDFRDGAVRAASCTSCGTSWWRGDDLHTLAALLAS